MKKISITFLAFVFLAGISSCVKEKYSSPPGTTVDPNITVNSSISVLKALYTNQPVQITQDYVISAVVVGDDRSGNLYKSLAIEDATGGITVSINGSDLYTTYPVGRRLFIQCKNLYVVQYDGLYELVAYVNADGTFGGIPTSTESQYIVPGTWGNKVTPIVTNISQFSNPQVSNALQSELIELDNVQFTASSRNQPYANPVTLTSGTLAIEDCLQDTAVIYSSGYANFAGAKTPGGNGKFLCIYGVYRSAPQLTIRDTTDIFFTGPLCP